MLRSTTSICPRCKRLLNAQLLERDGKVVLSRVCPDHKLQIPLELRPVRALIEMLEVQQAESLLDLGTGTGIVLRELAGSRGHRNGGRCRPLG